MSESRILGLPAGSIPEFLPKAWDPMVMLDDTEQIVHAVPSDNRSLCGYESGTGWRWARAST
jgi:hypothetical protein